MTASDMAPVYVRSVSEFGAPRETFGDATRLLCFPHISRHGSRGAGGFIWVYFHCDVMQFTISLQFVIIDTQIAGATILFFITDPPDVAGCNRGLQSLSRTTPQSILGRTHTPPEKKKHTLKEEIQGPLPSHSCEYVPNPYLAQTTFLKCAHRLVRTDLPHRYARLALGLYDARDTTSQRPRAPLL